MLVLSFGQPDILLGGHLSYARKRHPAKCLFGKRAQFHEVAPGFAGPHADQAQSQETLQYDIDLIDGGAGLLSDPSRLLAKSWEMQQTQDLKVCPIGDDGQSLRRPVAKLMLPDKRGLIGGMGGGNVSLGFFTIKTESPRPRVDFRHRNTASSAKDLRQTGMVGVKESSKRTQRIALVLLFSGFEFLPQTFGERGHWMIVIGEWGAEQ